MRFFPPLKKVGDSNFSSGVKAASELPVRGWSQLAEVYSPLE